MLTTNTLLTTFKQVPLFEEKKQTQLMIWLESFSHAPAEAVETLKARGWLTEYQANAILMERGNELILNDTYLILDLLGEGGMGQVLKAKHLSLDQMRAIKTIRPEFSGSSMALDRFQREMKLTARLDHPNVIRVFDAGHCRGMHYFVMEYLQGCDLSDVVAQRGRLPIHLAADYIRQAASGLQHAHENGMIHRDIKPSNLLLTDQGVVKILDLGLARATESKGLTVLTQTGQLMGTPDFIAPEQTVNAKRVDIRADIYSLGCSLYQLLAGQVPFPGGSIPAKLVRHCKKNPTPVEKLRSDVPPGLITVLNQMMAKRPERRLQIPQEAVSGLEPFCTGSTGSLGTVGGAQIDATLATRAEKTPHHNPLPTTRTTSGAPQTQQASAPKARTTAPASRPQTTAPHPRPQTVPVKPEIVSEPRSQKQSAGQKPTLVSPNNPVRPLRQRPKNSLIRNLALVVVGALLLGLGIYAITTTEPNDRTAEHRDTKGINQGSANPVVPNPTIDPKSQPPKQPPQKSSGEEKPSPMEEPPDRPKDNVDPNPNPAPGPKPNLTLAALKPVQLKASGADSIVVKITRTNIKGPVTIKVEGLPIDVTAEPLVIPEDQEMGTLRLSATANVAAFSEPVQVIATLNLTQANGALSLKVEGQALAKAVTSFKEHSEEIRSVAFAPDGKLAASASDDGTIRLWDVKTGQQLHQIPFRAKHIAFSTKGDRIAGGGWDKTARVWDIQTETEICKVQESAGQIEAVAFSTDDRFLVTGSSGSAVRLWDAQTGREVRSFQGFKEAVWCVACSPDGKHVLAGTGGSLDKLPGGFTRVNWNGGADCHVYVWDIQTGKLQNKLVGHTRPILCAEFSADGAFILSGASNGEIRLWEVKTGKGLKLFGRHSGNAVFVCFHPNRRWVISGGSDRAICVWDIKTETKVHQFLAQRERMYTAALSPDGKLVLSGSAGFFKGDVYLESKNHNVRLSKLPD